MDRYHDTEMNELDRGSKVLCDGGQTNRTTAPQWSSDVIGERVQSYKI